MTNLPLDYASPDLRRRSRGMGWLTKRLARPIGRPTHVATVIIFFGCLGGSINYIDPFWIAFIGVPLLLGWWIIRLLVWLAIVEPLPDRAPLRPGPWLVLPALASLAALLISFDLPARGLFALHRGELERLAKLAAASPTPVTWSRPVGLYGNVTITNVEPGIIGVSIRGMGVRRDDGYVYIASDIPPTTQPRFGWIQSRIAPRWFKWIRASY